MSRIAAAIRWLPGLAALDRYLCWRYTGSNRREVYRRGDYYSPLPDLNAVQARARTLFRQDSALEPGIDLRGDAQQALLADIAPFQDSFPYKPGVASAAHRFYLDQTLFSMSDAFVLHALMRLFRPKKIVEVGSGFSSALMLDTNELFLDHSVHLTCIEPFPQRLQSRLRDDDQQHMRLLTTNVQDVPLTVFAQLQAGDMLFIDSSHVAKVGSDVNHLFFQVLPRLRAGVIVHLHDIFWPFEYPEQWIMQGRAWNEAYLLRAFLQYNHDFAILLFNSYATHVLQAFVAQHIPLLLQSSGGSFWMRKLT